MRLAWKEAQWRVRLQNSNEMGCCDGLAQTKVDIGMWWTQSNDDEGKCSARSTHSRRLSGFAIRSNHAERDKRAELIEVGVVSWSWRVLKGFNH